MIQMPKKVLFLYSDYTEQCVVRLDGSMGATMPLRKETLKQIAKKYIYDNDEPIVKGWHPYITHIEVTPMSRSLIFQTPPSQVTVFSSMKDFRSGKYDMPSIEWHYPKDGDLDIFFLIDGKKYRAALPNINDEGSVCLGSAKIAKTADLNKLVNSIINGFWRSEFTHWAGTPFKGRTSSTWKNNKLISTKNLILHDKD